MPESFLDDKLGRFLDRAASGEPVPGGGAVAALAGALGAAMASMAANFTVGKPKFARHDAAIRNILEQLAPLGVSLRRAVDEDALAFSAISEAYRLPRDSEEDKARRRQAVAAALAGAMRTPLEVGHVCQRAAEFLPELAEIANPNLLSDVEVAAIMLEAAARAALVNVLVNANQLANDEGKGAEAFARTTLARVGELAAQTVAAIEKRVSKGNL